MSSTPASAAHAAALASDALGQLTACLRFLRESCRDTDLRSALLVAEGAVRGIEVESIRTVAAGVREGVFLRAGYRNDSSALSDLLQIDRAEAKRRIVVAGAVCERVSLTGEVSPPRLEATADVFAAGGISRRHVEVLAEVLDSSAARRVPAEDLAAAERHLAERAAAYTPRQLGVLAADVIRALDQDGPEPDEPDPAVNRVRLTRHRDGGGSISGRLDADRFGAVVAVLDPKSAPTDAADTRDVEQRQADALHDVCSFAMAHDGRPVASGGRRPQVIVTIDLADLEGRARAAMLATGDRLAPAELRRLACDAAVIPVVLGGDGQPVDVGRAQRVVSEPLRRAVIARDRGCAHPGCDRPPSWCEVHHVIPWQRGGPTAIHNVVMLCRHHHRVVHHDGWEISVTPSGRAVFRPPPWVDPGRVPLAA